MSRLADTLAGALPSPGPLAHAVPPRKMQPRSREDTKHARRMLELIRLCGHLLDAQCVEGVRHGSSSKAAPI